MEPAGFLTETTGFLTKAGFMKPTGCVKNAKEAGLVTETFFREED